MSPQHAEPRIIPRLACLTTVIGAAAAALLAAAPAEAATRTGASVPGNVAAASVASMRADGYAYLRNMDNVPRLGSAKKDDARSLPTADDVLKLAISQVGTTENAAGGSKFNQWFMTTPYAQQGVAQYGGQIADYANASWCDMFVSWLGDQLGVKGMGDNAFTPAHARWFQQQGRWGTVPKPGAVVFFSWNGDKSIDGIDHVGLVIKDDHDGTIQTVEGNTDNAVKIRTRNTDQVVGYGYPQYAQ